MLFRFTDEQEQLRREARRLLESGRALDWTGLAIAEEHGGAGLGWVELVAVLEESGRALAGGPFLGTVLAAAALELAGSPEQRARWLPGLAAGRTVAALAIAEVSARWDADGVRATATEQDAVSGDKRFVIDGHLADLFVIAARAPDGEVALYAIEAGAPGLTVHDRATLDQTRRLADLSLAGARAERLAGPGALDHIVDLACVAIAAEQVGGAERCLELAVDYAQTRRQFGRPIGSFQAIKHRLADLLLLVESARSAAYWAGWAAASGDPELPLAAPLAKAYCSDAFAACAGECIQVHGGIGFTWEHDAHRYFKRAGADAALFGDAAWHRERLARRIGI